MPRISAEELAGLTGQAVDTGPVLYFTPVGGASLENMDSGFMENLNRLAKDFYQKTGRQLRIVDAWRSQELQAKARAHWEETGENLSGQKVPAVGRAGTSYHPKGMAVDVHGEDVKRLEKAGLNLNDYGLDRPMSKEPWHIQPAEGFRKYAPKAVRDAVDYLSDSAPGKVFKGAHTTGGQTLGKYMEGAQAHEYAHTPISDIEDVQLVKPGTMVEQMTPDYDMTSKGLTDDLLYGLGGFMGMAPDLAFQTALAYGGMGPLTGAASPILQIAQRLGVPAGGFAGMTGGDPHSTLQDVGVAAGTGATLGALGPLPRLLRMPLAGGIGYGHAAYQQPDAPTHSKLASALLYSALSGVHGKQPLWTRAPGPAGGGGEPLQGQSSVWPPGGRPASELPPDLDIPPFKRGGPPPGGPQGPSSELPPSTRPDLDVPPSLRGGPQPGQGPRLGDVRAAAEADPFAGVSGQELPPEAYEAMAPTPDFRVGPGGEVMGPGVQPGVPLVPQAMRGVPPRSHMVSDPIPVMPPMATQLTDTPVQAERVAPGVIRPRPETKARKNALPGESVETRTTPALPQNTPELELLSAELTEIDRWLAQPGLEQNNPMAYRTLMAQRAVKIERGRALMQEAARDPEQLSEVDRMVRAAAERARAKPEAPPDTMEVSPEEPVSPVGEKPYSGEKAPHPLSEEAFGLVRDIVELRQQQEPLAPGSLRQLRKDKAIDAQVEAIEEKLDAIQEAYEARKKAPKGKKPKTKEEISDLEITRRLLDLRKRISSRPVTNPSELAVVDADIRNRLRKLDRQIVKRQVTTEGPDVRELEQQGGPYRGAAVPYETVQPEMVEPTVPPHQGPGLYRSRYRADHPTTEDIMLDAAGKPKAANTYEAVVDALTKEGAAKGLKGPKLQAFVEKELQARKSDQPLMEKWKTEAPPPVTQPRLTDTGKIPEGETPRRVAVRETTTADGKPLKEEYLILPPTESKPEWRLFKQIYKDGKFKNAGELKTGRSLQELETEVATNPEFKRAGIERVNEPVDKLDVFDIDRPYGDWENQVRTKEALKGLEGLEESEAEPGVGDFEPGFDMERGPTPDELRELEESGFVHEMIGEPTEAAPPRPRGRGYTSPSRESDIAQVQHALDVNRAWSDHRSTPLWRKVVDFLLERKPKEAYQVATHKTLRAKIREATSDISARTSDLLRSFNKEYGPGNPADDAEMLMRCQAGANRESSDVLHKVIPELVKGLSTEERHTLNDINFLNRVISIDSYKGEGKIKHPNNITGSKARAYLEELQNQLGERYNVLQERAARYNQHMLDMLKEMRNRGVIGEEDYQRMLKPDVFYVPRRFLQHLEGKEYKFNIGGRQISIQSSGLRPLDKGSLMALEHDSYKLLAEYTNRAFAKIHRNKANRQLAKVGDEMPETGLVRRLRPKEKPHRHEEVIFVREGEGEVFTDPVTGETYHQRVRTKRLAVDRELAQGWLVGDAQLSEATAKLFQTLSGTKYLKAMATGYNPAFGVANLPRDILTIFWSTFEYSSNPLRFATQMAGDLKATWRDAWFKEGTYKDYVKEGGGMEFLTTQGKLHDYTGKWKSALDMAGMIGEFTEVWSRLALRRRAMLKGHTPQRATYIARTYMDFHQGGTLFKAADNVFPYLNASMQGARAVGRAAWEHPGKTMWKVAQIGMMAAGLYAANSLANPEAMKQIPQEVLNNYWCFPLPSAFSYTDEFGKTRLPVLKIPKDQFSRVVGAVFEGAVAAALGLDYNSERLSAALWDFLPLFSNNLPPTAKAVMGYQGNYDYWRGRSLWKGAKVKPEEEYYTGRFGREPTHPVAVAWGKLTGMSPVRTKYALEQIFTQTNPFVLFPTLAARLSLGGGGDPQHSKSVAEWVTKTPLVNKFITSTSPYAAYGDQIAQYAEDTNTRKLLQNRGVDELSEVYYRDPTPENRKVVIDYIREQERVDRKDLMKRFQFNGQLYQLDEANRDWWLQVYSLPSEAKAQAFVDRYSKMDPEGQKQLMRTAMRLKGFGGQKFAYYVRRLNRPNSYASQ